MLARFFTYEATIPTTGQGGGSFPANGYKLEGRFEIHASPTQYSRASIFNESGTPLAHTSIFHNSQSDNGTFFGNIALTGYLNAFAIPSVQSTLRYPSLVMKTTSNTDTFSEISCPAYAPSTSSSLQTEIKLIVWEVDDAATVSTT